MITCSVCGTENDDLSVVCASCKGYLQGRVDALNLFSTMWGLIESPRATMKRVVLAKHKNYALILSALCGISVALDIAWYKSLVPDWISLGGLMILALVMGPFVGILGMSLLTLLLRQILIRFGGKATRKNLFAALAYATFPLALGLLFLVPLEVAIFGEDFFGSNPPPMLVKPVEYIILLGLKGVAALYMLYLLVEGTLAANGLSRQYVYVAAASIVSVLAAFLVSVHFLKV